jgi:hypothetical protein
MDPLHDYVAKQLGERLKQRKVVVWYDVRREFAPFIAELRGGPRAGSEPVTVSVEASPVWLAEYAGSMFELRAVVEPLISGDTPEALVIYVPGCERDQRGSVLMELETAGDCYAPGLKRLAKNVLAQRYTAGVVDELINPERVTYEDLARAASDSASPEPPSLLKGIFEGVTGNDGLLAAWLMSEARDVQIAEKEAQPELVKLIRSRLGLELTDWGSLAKLRALALRYVLVGEFRSDLRCPSPSRLDGVPAPKTKSEESALRDLAQRLRTSFPDAYAIAADRLEEELGLRAVEVPAPALGSIDTFRFEERALLGCCAELIADQKFADALAIVAEREHSFWLDRDVARKAHWEACRRMAELGAAAASVGAAIARASGDANAWIGAYTARPQDGEAGWYRLDQAQRRLEAWLTTLDEDPAERALGVVRRLYEDACCAMAEAFTKALAKAGWTATGSLHQTRIFSELVAARPKPVAYFLVDAMRYEMGVELAERLPKSSEVSLRHAVAALPSITPVGMAALQPGAAQSFSVVEQGGKLGSRIDGSFLPDLTARKKFAAARIPKLADLALDELLSLPQARLQKKVDGADIIVVRSQEIDHAGEAGFSRQARRIMDEVIGDIAGAIQRLARVGVEHAVVSADHGHLFFARDRDESMRTDAPGGSTLDLHRRCWIGRGGATPPGCVRVAASALGYESDLDLVFPTGSGVFKSGGDLAFHHGGPSLQELIIPVLAIRTKVRPSARPTAGPVSAIGLPDAVTNRIFSVTFELGGPTRSLFSDALAVRPLLVSAGKQVGALGMATGADFDRATGCVTLQANRQATVALILSDDTVSAVRVVVQDPTTDAELYRSAADIPVRLGV